MAATLTDLTPDSLLELQPPQNGKHYELSEGELMVVGFAGARREFIKSRILKRLFAWESQHAKGRVFAESMFSLGKRTARIPDAAVVLTERSGLIPEEDVAIPVPPDLAIEVISQTESAADADKNVLEYLAAGVEEVWQVYPDEQLVRVRWGGGLEDYEGNEGLHSRVLIGFETTVNKFFAD